MIKKGDRVGAYISNRDGAVEFLGYGVLSGFALPKEGVGYVCDSFVKEKRQDAVIKLDTGETVYGCECFWSTEEAVKTVLEKKQIVPVTVAAIRKKKKPETFPSQVEMFK